MKEIYLFLAFVSAGISMVMGSHQLPFPVPAASGGAACGMGIAAGLCVVASAIIHAADKLSKK